MITTIWIDLYFWSLYLSWMDLIVFVDYFGIIATTIDLTKHLVDDSYLSIELSLLFKDRTAAVFHQSAIALHSILSKTRSTSPPISFQIFQVNSIAHFISHYFIKQFQVSRHVQS